MASIIGEKILGLFKKYKGGLPLNFIATLLKPTTFAEVSGEAFSLVEEGRAKMGSGGLYPVEPAPTPQTADIGNDEAEAGAAGTGDEMSAPISNISSDRVAAPDNGASAGGPISYDSQEDNDGNKNEVPVTAAHGKAGILPTPEKTLLYVGPPESHPKDEENISTEDKDAPAIQDDYSWLAAFYMEDGTELDTSKSESEPDDYSWLADFYEDGIVPVEPNSTPQKQARNALHESSSPHEETDGMSCSPARNGGPLLFCDSVSVLSGVNARSVNHLRQAGITNIRDLFSKWETLTSMKGMGSKSVENLLDRLWNYALDPLCPLSKEQADGLSETRCLIEGCLFLDEYGIMRKTDSATRMSISQAAEPGITRPELAETTIITDPSTESVAGQLQNNEFTTVGKLLDTSDKELPSIPYFGKEAFHTVENSRCEYERNKEIAGQTTLILKRVIEDCVSNGIPVFDDAVVPIIAPTAQSLASANQGDEIYNELVDRLSTGAGLTDACAAILAHTIETTIEQEKATGVFATHITLERGECWLAGARILAERESMLELDSENRRLLIKRTPLEQWVATFGDKAGKALRLRLSGKTLQEIGDAIGVTRERARQLLKKFEDPYPVLIEEDLLLPLVDEYEINADTFTEVTGLTPTVYHYLAFRSKTKRSDKLSLEEAGGDERIPEAVRARIRKIAPSGVVIVGEERVSLKETSIIDHLASRHARDRYITLEQLLHLYQSFLSEHELTGMKRLDPTSERAFGAVCKRCDRVLSLPNIAVQKYGGSIRYYDTDCVDLTELITLLARSPYRDVEVSAQKLFDDPLFSDALESADIRNAYELHCVIRNHCLPIKGLSLGSCPTIKFGECSRHEQILEIIKRFSPTTAAEISEEYSHLYGTEPSTVMGSYLTEFKYCLRNGKYVFSDEPLTAGQSKLLKSLLTKDYHSLSLIAAQFKHDYPDCSTTLLNARNLESLGYIPEGGLVVRNGLDIRNVFGGLIDSHPRFSSSDDGFGKDVMESEPFRQELSSRMRSFSVVEYEEDKYIHASELARRVEEVKEEDLADYVESALSFMEPNIPYTVPALRLAGFTHKLDILSREYGFGDLFYESLISQAFIGGRVKTTSVASKAVFCKTRYSFSSVDLLEHVLTELGHIEICDLADLLLAQYGIEADPPLLRGIAKRSTAFYDEHLDMVFIDSEEYERKALEWISISS